MTEDLNGYLPAGLHDMSMEHVYKEFVAGMPLSQTRESLFTSMVACFRAINAKYSPVEIWIDGSFLSDKINPNDVDMVIYMDALELVQMHEHGDINVKFSGMDIYYSFAATQTNETILGSNYNSLAVNQRNYWRGQFGFDRKDTPKGIARLNWDDVKLHLIGGVT